MLFTFFKRRKKSKFLAELRARRHAEDDVLTSEQKQAFDAVISEFAASDPAEFKASSALAEEKVDSELPPYMIVQELAMLKAADVAAKIKKAIVFRYLFVLMLTSVKIYDKIKIS